MSIKLHHIYFCRGRLNSSLLNFSTVFIDKNRLPSFAIRFSPYRQKEQIERFPRARLFARVSNIIDDLTYRLKNRASVAHLSRFDVFADGSVILSFRTTSHVRANRKVFAMNSGENYPGGLARVQRSRYCDASMCKRK